MTIIRRLFLAAGAAAIVGGLASCASSHEAVKRIPPSSKPASPLLSPPLPSDGAPRDYPGIHNAVAYHDGFVSGSAPEGDAGFSTLARMGVKTIISVDGAVPDVEKATALGIRYIHLPIGYNGFDEQRKLELVRATRDAMRDGAVYIHCHHGKHRSAGAAATIAASLGWETPQAAVERMRISGTATDYKGLYACAGGAFLLGTDAIDAVPANFPEVSRPVGFVKSMVEIDEISEHLKLIEKAGWTTPADHPDLVPAAEAGRMADLFRVLADADCTQAKPVEFAEMLRENGRRAQSVEDLLVARAKDAAALSAQFKLMSTACKDCHAKYRD